jgi:hypothetical protein
MLGQTVQPLTRQRQKLLDLFDGKAGQVTGRQRFETIDVIARVRFDDNSVGWVDLSELKIIVDLDRIPRARQKQAPAALAKTGPRKSRKDDGFAAARERGRAVLEKLAASPAMLSADGIGERLGIRRQTVHTWRKQGRLLALTGAKRGFLFPEWQVLENGTLLPGLAELGKELGTSWALYRFLMQPQPGLSGSTGLEALSTGRHQEAITIAHGLSEGYG